MVVLNTSSWITQDGLAIASAQGLTADNKHLPSTFAEQVACAEQLANPDLLAFRDPDRFISGSLHDHIPRWVDIASHAPFYHASEVLDWIRNNVDVTKYFRHFKGSFQNIHYESEVPPRSVFVNHSSGKDFCTFISTTILQRLTTGAISVWDKVGEIEPPHLAMPLNVEPSKPRLCNDDRFLNLWMGDKPFSLDHLSMLPCYVPPHLFQTVCDDKLGYDHIFLTESSRIFFGFEWADWFFTSNTIPFVWKLSAYIHHNTGLLASHFFRSIATTASSSC